MWIMFSISGWENDIDNVKEIEREIKNICTRYNLVGSTEGGAFDQGAWYTGFYKINNINEKDDTKKDFWSYESGKPLEQDK